MPVLLNPHRYGAGAVPADAFVDVAELSTNVAVYTFTGRNIGTAHAQRVLVVGSAIFDSGSNNRITGITVDGLAMTQAADSTNGTPDGTAKTCSIFYRAHTTSTTAEFEVTCDNAATSCAIAVMALYPSSLVLVDGVGAIASSAGSVTASNVAISSGGDLVAISVHNNGQATTWSWTGTDTFSKLVDSVLGDSAIVYTFAAFHADETTTTDDATANHASGTVGCGIAAASFGG